MHENEKHWLQESLKPMPPGVSTWGKISTKLFSWTAHLRRGLAEITGKLANAFKPRRRNDISLPWQGFFRRNHRSGFGKRDQKNGMVTDKLVQRYRKIANGGVGLIIPGYLYVHPKGKCTKYQTGIYNDDMIEGLKEIVDAAHLGRSKIVFQLAHSGRQTFKENIGQTDQTRFRRKTLICRGWTAPGKAYG